MSYSPYAHTTATTGHVGLVRLGTGVGGQSDGTIVTTSAPNEVLTSGSYTDPSWITSLSGSKLSGTVVATNGVVTSGSYADPSWITSLSGSKLSGTVVATNGVVTTGNYADPSWITSIAGSKIGGGAIIVTASGTQSVSASSGALQVNGGVGISGNMYVGGTLFATTVTSVSQTQVTVTSTFTITNVTQSFSTNTGALQVSGGAGIGGNMYVGGYLHVPSIIRVGDFDQLVEGFTNEYSLASGASYSGTADTWTQNQPYLWSTRVTQGQMTQLSGNLIRIQYTNTNASNITWQDVFKIDTNTNGTMAGGMTIGKSGTGNIYLGDMARLSANTINTQSYTSTSVISVWPTLDTNADGKITPLDAISLLKLFSGIFSVTTSGYYMPQVINHYANPGTGITIIENSPTRLSNNLQGQGAVVLTSAAQSSGVIKNYIAVGNVIETGAIGGAGVGVTISNDSTLTAGTYITSSITSTSITSGALVVNGGVGISGSVNVGGVVKTGVYTATSILSASVAGAGARAFVTDSYATTFGTAYVGGSTNAVPVWSDGHSWFIG